MSLIISPPLSKILTELARKQGIPVDLFLAKIAEKDLDPNTRIKMYLEIFERLLKEVEEYERKGDLIQASEKYWEAICALLNIIGEIKGMPHYRHSDYWEIIEEIISETRDRDIARFFSVAERLHANFYHNFIRKENFHIYSSDVKALIKKLKNYIKSKGIQI